MPFVSILTIINTKTPTGLGHKPGFAEVKHKEHKVPALKALRHVTGLSIQTFNTSLSMNETKYCTPPHSVLRSLRGTKHYRDEKKKKKETVCTSSLRNPSYQNHFKNFYSTIKLT